MMSPRGLSTMGRTALATTLLMMLLLGGCTTTGTTPTAESAQYGATYNYLPVNDVPHDDQRPVLTTEQQEKLRKELAAVRDRQVPAAVKATAAKSAPASSSTSTVK
ncbi:hypothetical protein HL667_04860 [Bradyrhizobium sp. 83012]|uniref:Lipoprotein n=2 Tax=Bradyrhizobium aeschynomenes TaxID=2734909 RepID=A0ABX2C7T4_9BRAD|nr:hypothetical protein [Bradyrhizobium aeschynomenes]NPV21379.1 hypothetical protein [Bradyrhizobium aeschynomenes]